MKSILLAVLTISFAFIAAGAGNLDLEIQAVAKTIGQIPPREEGHRTVSSERMNFEVTVENKAFHPLGNIEVRYMIFYRKEDLGLLTPAQQQHKSGSFSVDALQPHAKNVFPTDNFELNKSTLLGNRYYRNGGRTRGEDTLVGIWVRAYAAGQLVGEYASPSTLTKEQWQ